VVGVGYPFLLSVLAVSSMSQMVNAVVLCYDEKTVRKVLYEEGYRIPVETLQKI